MVGDATDVSGAVYNVLPGTKTRLGYTNHYDNCAAVLDYAKTQGVTVTHVALAVGTNFPDGLSAGACLARDSGLLLLTDTTAMPSCITQRLSANKATITTLDAIGSTNVVSDAVAGQAKAALQ